MANNAFDRTNFGLRERPVSADFNRNMSQSDRSIREALKFMCSARSLSSPAGVPYTGFFGDGFRVVPSSPIGLSVQLTPGLGFFYDPISLPVDLGATDLEGVDDRSSYKPMLLTAPQSFAVPAAPTAGNSRTDIIEARYDRRLEDSETRRQLDAGTKAFLDHVFTKTLSFVLDGQVGTVNSPSASTAPLSYKVGAVAATGSQVEPTVTSGYVQVARINVGPTVTTIDSPVLVDRRPLLNPGGALQFAAWWRLQWNGGAPIVTAENIVAPPSIQLGLAANASARGSGTVYIVGGQIKGAAMTIDAAYAANAASTSTMASLIRDIELGPLTGFFPLIFNSSVAAAAAAAVPPVISGVGATGASTIFLSRFDTGGAINNTDAALEDVYVSVTGALTYQS